MLYTSPERDQSKVTRILISAHKTRLVLVASRLVPNLRGLGKSENMIGLRIRQFGKLQKGCSLLQRLMGRMFSNKNVEIELESFLLYSDSSERMKALGKDRRNVIVFNCKKAVR